MLKTIRKHEKLTELLRAEIRRRKFPDNRFYTAKYLMEHYRVSQATLAKALQPLYDAGLIYAVSGKGTFVSETPPADAVADTSAVNLFCVFSDTEMFSRESNPTDWFVLRDIIAGIADAGERCGWNVHLSPMRADIELFKGMADSPNRAFIFTCYRRFEQLIEHCIKGNIPYAVYSVHQPVERNINQLWVDTREAVRKTTAHLISRGHWRIAFLGDGENSPRHKGYKQALREAGIPIRGEWSFFTSGKPEEAAVLSECFLREQPEVSAVVCSSDLRAMGVVEAARRLGRNIPGFGITGVDNIGEVFPGLPRLTTVDLMRQRVGAELIRMVQNAIAAKTVETVEIDTELVVGETS